MEILVLVEVLRDFLFVVQCISVMAIRPGHSGDRVKSVREHSSISSIGRFIQGMSRPRDVSSKGHSVEGTHRSSIMFRERSVGNTSYWHLIACVCVGGGGGLPLTSYYIKFASTHLSRILNGD
jgi:hypothetical protein